MERDDAERTGPTTDTRFAQPTTRIISPLVINSASRRRSLFSRPRAKEDAARPASSGSVSDFKTASPSNTKIPRPAQRPLFTISDAYRKAAEEEAAAQGSPSPAPRSWRSRRASVGKGGIKTGSPVTSDAHNRGELGQNFLRTTRRDSQAELDAPSQQSDLSDSGFEEKLRQYAQDQKHSEEPDRRSNGLFSGSRLGTRIVETGKELLVRKSSRSSIDASSSPRVGKATTSSPSLLRRLSGRRRESGDAASARASLDWAQSDKNSFDEPRQPDINPSPGLDSRLPDFQTPNRSFAWQAEADFTAGDLQVSNSPPVVLGRRNTKIDEIRALEVEVNSRAYETCGSDLENDRISNNRAIGMDAASLATNEPLEAAKAVGDAQEAALEIEDRIPTHRPVSRASMRMDELRSREIESLSRRVLATAALDESRERNIRASRSPSPDVAEKFSREPRRASSPLRDRLRRHDSEGPAIMARTEVDVAGQNGQSALGTAIPIHDYPTVTAADGGQSVPQTRDAQGSLSRRLAAVTNGHTAAEAQATTDSQAPAALSQEPTERAKQRRLIGSARGVSRPTVGFAGLSRRSSAESSLAKRASFAHSDSDPTERIEGEMKLFAAQENQSERGSLRAPSPEPEEVPDETPRPIKIDPLTQPTPRVTGAFVETPATIKVEKLESLAASPTEAMTAETQSIRSRRPSAESSGVPNPSLAEDGRDASRAGHQKRTQSSKGDRKSGRSSSLSARRRARSLSRSRAPLINSARPPTVRDDLLEIQRANQIDDSTLDDIADLLVQHELQGHILGSQGIKSEPSSNNRLDRDKELEAYDRMSRSLETGLLGIRSAKQGIERLEGKVAHVDTTAHLQHTTHDNGTKGDFPSCTACRGSKPTADAAVTYVHLPLPRLWYRQPKFRFTLLGLSLFLLSLWYIAESWMCFRYCKPEYCYPGKPCDWSADDPVWGYAIPVKLDQWVTGGKGRSLVRRVRPEAADWLADMWDAAMGVDIATADTSGYSWEQKRQYRRRLAKKGLRKPFVERQEDEAVFSGWRSVREANERAQAAQEMGYQVDEDESIGRDERL